MPTPLITVTVPCFHSRWKPLLSVRRGRRSRQHPPAGRRGRRTVQGGERKDELAAPPPHVAELFCQFAFQVPRQRQHHIWAILGQETRIANRDAHTGREAAVLVWIAVDDVLDKIAAYQIGRASCRERGEISVV